MTPHELNEMLCKAQAWRVSLVSYLRSFVNQHKHCFLDEGRSREKEKILCTCGSSYHRQAWKTFQSVVNILMSPSRNITVIYIYKIMHSGSRYQWRVTQLAGRTLSLLSDRLCLILNRLLELSIWQTIIRLENSHSSSPLHGSPFLHLSWLH